jgi:hypothetical protein
LPLWMRQLIKSLALGATSAPLAGRGVTEVCRFGLMKNFFDTKGPDSCQDLDIDNVSHFATEYRCAEGSENRYYGDLAIVPILCRPHGLRNEFFTPSQ